MSSLSVRVNGSANEKKLKSFTEMMKHEKVPPHFFNSSESERLSLNTIFQFSRHSRETSSRQLAHTYRYHICVYDYGKVGQTESVTRWYFLIQ